jgi:hypothetical protein
MAYVFMGFSILNTEQHPSSTDAEGLMFRPVLNITLQQLHNLQSSSIFTQYAKYIKQGLKIKVLDCLPWQSWPYLVSKIWVNWFII